MENKYGERRIQVRCEYDNNRIHIQGVGNPTINREYGVALELRAPPELTDWLREQEPTNTSPASGAMYYVESMLLHYQKYDTYQLLISGDELNHKSGAMLDLSMESNTVQMLVGFIEKMEIGPAARCLMIVANEKPFSTDGGEEE